MFSKMLQSRINIISMMARVKADIVLGVLAWICGSVLVAGPRPNVLVIYTDEHHFNTLGCYGGSIVETPHIDSIASRGALCTSFYAATPVCSPSRASLVSGRYPQNTGVVQNNLVLDDDVLTFGEILKRKGYATGWAGKWHLAGDGKPQWAPPSKFGFEDNRYMFNRGHWKMLADGQSGPEVGSKNKKGKPDYGLAGADQSSYATDWLVSKAIEFVREHAYEPFCYVVSLPDPHGPNRVRPPYDTMYVGREVPIPASLTKEKAAFPAWAPRSPKINPLWLRANMPQYYGMVKCIDDNVGRLLAALRQTGTLENTIIIFTSDHGDLCGEHGRTEKGVPYEGSARIPFLMAYPGKVPANLRINQALTTADLLPTLLGLMNLTVSGSFDGRDASSLFVGKPATDWEDIAFFRGTTGNRWLAAVTDDWKLVLAANEKPWLFDLKGDPLELKNHLSDPGNQGIVRSLVEGLERYGERIGDPYLSLPGIREQLQTLRQL